MRSSLTIYTDPVNGNSWVTASMDVIRNFDMGQARCKNDKYAARRLCQWTKEYIQDREVIPINNYEGSIAMVEDKDFKQDLFVHLQGIGKYVRAADIVDYTNQEDVKAKFDLKKGVSLATAKRWMFQLGYRWQKTPSGQYVDGHEREDVVAYSTVRRFSFQLGLNFKPGCAHGKKKISLLSRQSQFLGKKSLSGTMTSQPSMPMIGERYGGYMSQRKQSHSQKVREHLLMVADFISADYGWLRSPDENKRAHVFFKAGKNRDGYFDCEDVLEQAGAAMDILQKHFHDEEHVFIFDNTKTHTKRADDALSARRMPKNTPSERKNWGVSVTEQDANGKIVYDTNGKPQKVTRHMADACFLNGKPQSLYFLEGHPRAGVFKGMARILEERGLIKESKLRAECKRFKCAPGQTACCVRQVLYNQPDFASVKSQLEIACKQRGFRVIFLPKFHCELNFIEMCWGYAKWVYCTESTHFQKMRKS
jgi:hypothetical protein